MIKRRHLLVPLPSEPGDCKRGVGRHRKFAVPSSYLRNGRARKFVAHTWTNAMVPLEVWVSH